MNILLFVTLLGFASAFVERGEWAAFKNKHGKSYSNPLEELRRMKIYAGHKAFVEQHQKEFAAGLHTFEVELNKFADLSTEEWSRLHKGFKSHASKTNPIHKVTGNARQAEVDWREEGYVTPVKNQGRCGSCWAFSATGSLEGAYVRAGNKLTSFSEQQLVDCSTSQGNNGCDGGLMDYAFKYIEREGGLEREEDYPYSAKNHRCEVEKSKEVPLSVTYTDVRSKDESALEDAVSSIGPVSVAIDAGHTSFQLYKRGVYREPACSSSKLDHGVLAVGYGTSNGEKYWLVKNSWGSNWGENGYVNMLKDSRNQCGIATEASYPTVA